MTSKKEILRPEYRDELRNLEEKMIDAQKFAEYFPSFSEIILRNKFTHEFTGQIADSYKGLYFAWGIKRWFYREKSNIINYTGEGEFDPKYLWCIYINQASLFSEYQDTGLYDIKKEVDVFFFDPMNTTFYATDEQIMPLLDALSEWYKKASAINAEFRKEKKKQELLSQLERLK